ncbi:hypothetical protein BDZ90DRAFT_279506 [Jaminaea rosea]|uniref:HMG box domain-containing protein n=1 Tax=Jaminaea rosea TaxID=1569628 RepID=A0A316UX82_9BASI|nr:hypothetical protein BDZ90DRAFT_279506 [Jaminaea rosea]PWN27735.1 hypothetical protein BDZ90DRAFT_279506 [Jaminaea rosea]
MPPERRSQTGSSPAVRDKFSSGSAAALALSSRRTGEGLSYDEQVTRELQDAGGTLLYQEPRPDGGPRRPMNAFLIYARWRRMQMSQDTSKFPILLPISDSEDPSSYVVMSDGTKKRKKGPKPSDISAALGDEWTRLSTAAQRPFHAKANELRAEFDAANPEYKFTRGPKGAAKQRRLEKQRLAAMGNVEVGGMAEGMYAMGDATPQHLPGGRRRQLSDLSSPPMSLTASGACAAYSHPGQVRYHYDEQHHQQQQRLLHLGQLPQSQQHPYSDSLPGRRLSLASQGRSPKYLQHAPQSRVTSVPMVAVGGTIPSTLAASGQPWHHAAPRPLAMGGRQRSLSYGQRISYVQHSTANVPSQRMPHTLFMNERNGRQRELDAGTSSSSLKLNASPEGFHERVLVDSNESSSASSPHQQSPRGRPNFPDLAPHHRHRNRIQPHSLHQLAAPRSSIGAGHIQDQPRDSLVHPSGGGALGLHNPEPALPPYSGSEENKERTWLAPTPVGRTRAASMRTIYEGSGPGAQSGSQTHWAATLQDERTSQLRRTYQARDEEEAQSPHALSLRTRQGDAGTERSQRLPLDGGMLPLNGGMVGPASYTHAYTRGQVQAKETLRPDTHQHSQLHVSSSNGHSHPLLPQQQNASAWLGGPALTTQRGPLSYAEPLNLPTIRGSPASIARDYSNSQQLAPLLAPSWPSTQKRRRQSLSIQELTERWENGASSAQMGNEYEEDRHNSTLARFASVAAGVDSRCQTGAITATGDHGGMPMDETTIAGQSGLNNAILPSAEPFYPGRPHPDSHLASATQSASAAPGGAVKIEDENPFAYRPPDDSFEVESEAEREAQARQSAVESRRICDDIPVPASMSMLFDGTADTAAAAGRAQTAHGIPTILRAAARATLMSAGSEGIDGNFAPVVGTSHSEPWFGPGSQQEVEAGNNANVSNDPWVALWQRHNQQRQAGLFGHSPPEVAPQQQLGSGSVDVPLLSAPATAVHQSAGVASQYHPATPVLTPSSYHDAIQMPRNGGNDDRGEGQIDPSHLTTAHYDAAHVLHFWKTPPTQQVPLQPDRSSMNTGLKPTTASGASEPTLTSPLTNALQLERNDPGEAEKRLAANHELVKRAVEDVERGQTSPGVGVKETIMSSTGIHDGRPKTTGAMNGRVKKMPELQLASDEHDGRDSGDDGDDEDEDEMVNVIGGENGESSCTA